MLVGRIPEDGKHPVNHTGKTKGRKLGKNQGKRDKYLNQSNLGRIKKLGHDDAHVDIADGNSQI